MRHCLGSLDGKPCTTLVTKGRCPAHTPTTTQRGYGSGHQQVRALLSTTLPRFCGYGCGTWLTATTPWHAAHVVDGDPSAGYLVSCVPCNERARGVRRNLGAMTPT